MSRVFDGDLKLQNELQGSTRNSIPFWLARTVHSVAKERR